MEHKQIINYLGFLHASSNKKVGLISNSSDLYLGGARFESQAGSKLS
jgi:hypothetical protein